MSTTPAGTDRWKKLDFARPSADAEEPESSVLVDYRKDDQIAVITLNRPQADNAITTEMGARLTEIVETSAVRTAASKSRRDASIATSRPFSAAVTVSRISLRRETSGAANARKV